MMTSGSTLGHIAVWNLEKKCLHSQLISAHNGPVNGMKFLPNEPLMLTSSADNSVKVINACFSVTADIMYLTIEKHCRL